MSYKGTNNEDYLNITWVWRIIMQTSYISISQSSKQQVPMWQNIQLIDTMQQI